MKAAIICIIGLVGSWGQAGAEPLVEGRVRLLSGQPVPGAQVLLFDLTNLRAAPLGAITDQSGHFTLSGALPGTALPERFELGWNYPNPFNPSTLIPYRLPSPMHVRLEVSIAPSPATRPRASTPPSPTTTAPGAWTASGTSSSSTGTTW